MRCIKRIILWTVLLLPIYLVVLAVSAIVSLPTGRIDYSDYFLDKQWQTVAAELIENRFSDKIDLNSALESSNANDTTMSRGVLDDEERYFVNPLSNESKCFIKLKLSNGTTADVHIYEVNHGSLMRVEFDVDDANIFYPIVYAYQHTVFIDEVLGEVSANSYPYYTIFKMMGYRFLFMRAIWQPLLLIWVVALLIEVIIWMRLKRISENSRI